MGAKSSVVGHFARHPSSMGGLYTIVPFGEERTAGFSAKFWTERQAGGPPPPARICLW